MSEGKDVMPIVWPKMRLVRWEPKGFPGSNVFMFLYLWPSEERAERYVREDGFADSKTYRRKVENLLKEMNVNFDFYPEHFNDVSIMSEVDFKSMSESNERVK